MIKYRTVLLGAAALVVVIATGAAGTANAEQQEPGHSVACVRSGAAAGKAPTTDNLAKFALSMQKAGKTSADIDKALTTQWCLKNLGKSPAGEPPIHTASDGDGRSDNADIQWLGLRIYTCDDCYGYYAVVDYKWRNRDYMGDVSDLRVSCHWNTGIGGKDAFALRLSGGEYRINGFDGWVSGDWSLNQYEGDYDFVQVAAFSQVNQYGIGFTWQDNVRYVKGPAGTCNQAYPDLDNYAGSLWLDFAPLDGNCHDTQVFGTVIHTWNDTAVTGISAGRDGFGIEWENRADDFTLETAGETVRVC